MLYFADAQKSVIVKKLVFMINEVFNQLKWSKLII